MKKAVCRLLICMLLGNFTMTVYAKNNNPHQENQIYSFNAYYEDIYNNYCNLMDNFAWNYLKEDRHNAYVGLINQTADLRPLILESSVLVGAALDQERYIEILVNLLGTMDVGITEVMSRQAEADTIKTAADYALDAAGIMAGAIDADSVDFSAVNAKIAKETEALLDAMDMDKSIVDFMVSDMEALERYYLIMEKYGLYQDLLDIIIKRTDSRELAEAAATLKTYADHALYIKLAYFNEIGNSLNERIGKDIFFDQIVLEMLENPDIISNSMENQAILKFLGSFYKNVESGKMVYALGIFAGDMLFGTTNTFIRYNEMYVMKLIRDTLLEEIDERSILIKGPEQAEEAADTGKLFKYLLYVNSRGEYCLYSLLTKDAQILSLVNIGEHEDYQEWFHTVQEINNSISAQIDNLIPEMKNYEAEEEKTDETESYIKFLNGKGYSGYTQNWIYGEADEYTIIDIDEDGYKELIITGGNDRGFYNFAIFGYDRISGEIYEIPVAEKGIWGQGEVTEGEEGESSEYMAQYYGGLSYAPQYQALVFTEFHNGVSYSNEGFWIIKDKMLDVEFALWSESDADGTVFGINRAGDKSLLSESEYMEYMEACEFLEWSEIGSSGAFS